MSDVFSLSYVCCLLVNTMAFSSEDWNILLRYTAFALAWIFKTKDSWGSSFWETVLISCYIVTAVISLVTRPSLLKAFDTTACTKGLALLAVALGCLTVELERKQDPFKLLAGIGHIFVGAALYYLWQAVPVMDSFGKKNDDVLDDYKYEKTVHLPMRASLLV